MNLVTFFHWYKIKFFCLHVYWRFFWLAWLAYATPYAIRRNVLCCDRFVPSLWLKLSTVYTNIAILLTCTCKKMSPINSCINKSWLPNTLSVYGTFFQFTWQPIDNHNWMSTWQTMLYWKCSELVFWPFIYPSSLKSFLLIFDIHCIKRKLSSMLYLLIYPWFWCADLWDNNLFLTHISGFNVLMYNYQYKVHFNLFSVCTSINKTCKK